MTVRYTHESASPRAEFVVKGILLGVPEYFKAAEWALITGAFYVAAKKLDTWELWALYGVSWSLLTVWIAMRLARLLPDRFDTEARFKNKYFTQGVMGLAIVTFGTLLSWSATSVALHVIQSVVG